LIVIPVVVNGLFSGTTWLSWYEKDRTILDFNEARDNGVTVASAGPYANQTVPSVLWRRWLGSRKDIWRAKNWVVGCSHGCLSGVRCRFAYGPADATATLYLLLQCQNGVIPILVI